MDAIDFVLERPVVSREVEAFLDALIMAEVGLVRLNSVIPDISTAKADYWYIYEKVY